MRIAVIPLVMLLTACGPKPPETMMAGYFEALLFKRDRDAALALSRHPVGLNPPADKPYCFNGEEGFWRITDAYFIRQQAADANGRRKAWRQLKRDEMLMVSRANTTVTTATVQYEFDPDLITQLALDPPPAKAYHFVMLRDADGSWRVTDVQARN